MKIDHIAIWAEDLEKSPLVMSAAKVAKAGYDGLMRNKTIVIPGFVNRMMAFSVRLMPRDVVKALTAYLNKK